MHNGTADGNDISNLPSSEPLNGPAHRLLMENGCSMTETKPWDPAFPACVAYQGCNPLYPVVWCQTSGMGHSNGGMYSSKGFWKFWMTLPP